MASPVFDKEQYELRGHVPTPMTDGQKTVLDQVLSRVNGQLDWNAQLLGFSGTSYWGKRIPTTDGSYKWKGLPETVSEKRAVQTGAFGVYAKDKDYSERPAPFNRSEVRASADLTFDIFEENGTTKVVPFGVPRGVLYEENPRLIVGGEYTFNALVEVEANTGATEWLYVVQDLDQGITSVRLLGTGAESEAIFVKIQDSEAQPFLFFLATWEDVSDWTSQQILDQFIGVWGNKGAAVASHFLFDALDVHGFSEEEGLSLDNIVESITVADLLGLVGLVPGPATPYITDHYNFFVEGCDDLYQPTVSLETKIVRIQTEDYLTLLTENGFEISEDDGACSVLAPPGIVLETDGPDEPTTIIDNGTFEDTTPPVDTLNNGEYPGSSSSTVSDDGVFGTQGGQELMTESFDLLSINDPSYDNSACYLPPDAEFGVCDTPNYVLTLRQAFDDEPDEIAIDPGPETSNAIGCNGVQYLFPPTCFIDNGEFPSTLGQFFLDGGDYDFPVIATSSVGDGIYDRDPFSVCDGLPEDYERIIEGDDLVVDVAGEAGPILMSDPGADNEIVLVASGGEYDGFIIAFDGLELETVSFEYEAKTVYGETRFPCVEWVFDPTLDNSTYFPTPLEAAWMGTDDGEYDRVRRPSPIASQSDVPCLGNLTFVGGFLSFDDGVFDQIVTPNCDYIDNAPKNCAVVDGGFYQIGVNPLTPPLSNTECSVECGTVDGGVYIYGQPLDTLVLLDSGSIDTCTIYDNTYYDLVQPGQQDLSCINYNNGSYSNSGQPILCVISDNSSFNSGEAYTGPNLNDGLYTTQNIVEVIVLATESGLELATENDDKIGYDPAIIIPVTEPSNCAPCGVDPEPLPIDCVLDNGTLESSGPPTGFASDGLYDRTIDPFCVPCEDPSAPVVPCPVEMLRVRLDQIIFSAPRWRMRPSVMNSLSPLRLWKNRTLDVPDPEVDNAYINPLVADENSGPENPNAYRHFARLPVEYQRNGKFWSRAQAVLANESYFSRALPAQPTQLPVIDEKPLLYDEVYQLGSSLIPDDATFYSEDFLVSTVRVSDDVVEDGFVSAREVYEEPDNSLPFVSATILDYDAYEARLLNADGTRVGRYLKWNRRDRRLTGFLQTDIDDYSLRYTVASEPVISDASRVLIPNIEFPDDPDEASFSNYVVCYAYFVADMSAGDDPVFDPANWISHREKAICEPAIDEDELTTENGLVILTQDYEPIVANTPSELIEIQHKTISRYIFNDDTIPPCKEPVVLEEEKPRTRPLQAGTATIGSGQLSRVSCESATFELVKTTGISSPFVTYQWQINFGSNWIDLNESSTYVGVNLEDLTINGLTTSFDGAKVRLKITYGFSPQYVTFSNQLTLEVAQAAISITSQPQSVLATTSPFNVNFLASATSNDGGALSYQWQQNEGSGWVNLSDSPSIVGSNTNSLSIVGATSSLNNSEYRLRVTSTGCAEPVFSSVAELTFPQPAAQADYFVITYTFSNGSDLDTRTRMLQPAQSSAVGWGQGVVIGVPAFITWGGDNTGTGVESVLFDKAAYLASYPGQQQIVLDLRAMWYGSVGTNPVVINVTSYAGGQMVRSGFSWTNPTATATYTNFTSTSKQITLLSRSASDPGERVATMTLDFVQGVVTYGS